MLWYRMYFVDKLGKFRWPYDLHAEDDASALAMAHALQEACSDVPVGIELWQGARRIPGTSNRTSAGLRANWEAICAQRPEALLRMEEALHNSGTAIARSRRLQQRMNELKLQIESRNSASVAPSTAEQAYQGSDAGLARAAGA